MKRVAMPDEQEKKRYYVVSYPRSGNTWVRLLLEYSLGFKTTSVYQDEERMRTKAYGHRLHPIRKVTKDDSHLVSEPKIKLVKTHQFSLSGSDPVIYVLRDGRDATASYWHFSREFGESRGQTFSQFLRYLLRTGNWWATHVHNWLFAEHSHKVLLIRFEDLLIDPDKELGRMIDFLQVKPVRYYRDFSKEMDFQKLSAAWPEFFRSGKSSSWREAFSSDDEEFFLANDLGCLKRLGYLSEPATVKCEPDFKKDEGVTAPIKSDSTPGHQQGAQESGLQEVNQGLADVEGVQVEELLLYYFLSEKVKVRHMIDVGAHHGFTLEPFVLAGWTVDAFEPVQQNLIELKRSFGKIPGLRVHAEAVSSQSGEMDFHLARRQDGSLHDFYHSLEQIAEDAYHRRGETVKVRTVSLDDLIRSGQLPKKVGFLKTDTEGHDLKVLLGAKSLVSDVVSVEFWRDAHPLGKSPSPAERMIDLMRERGYESFLVINHEGLDVELQFSTFDASETAWGNIVFFSNHQTHLYDQCVRFSGSFRLLRGMRSSLSNTAEERLKLIQELVAVAEGRARSIEEKEKEIERLDASLTERLQAIRDAARAQMEKEELISAIHKVADERAAALEEKEELIRSLETIARNRERSLEEKEEQIVATQKTAEERGRELLEKEQEISATQKAAEERAAALLEKEQEIGATQKAAAERAQALIEKEGEIATTQKAAEERARALLEKEGMISAIKRVAQDREDELKSKENGISEIHLVAEERARLLREKEEMIRALHDVAEERSRVLQLINEELERIKRHWVYRAAVHIKRMLEKMRLKGSS